jgi:excisionase family DNA binding protein
VTFDELELLTMAEVAKLWHVSQRTVRRRVAAGELPVVRLGRNTVRIRAEVAARVARGDHANVVVPLPGRSLR